MNYQTELLKPTEVEKRIFRQGPAELSTHPDITNNPGNMARSRMHYRLCLKTFGFPEASNPQAVRDLECLFDEYPSSVRNFSTEEIEKLSKFLKGSKILDL